MPDAMPASGTTSDEMHVKNVIVSLNMENCTCSYNKPLLNVQSIELKNKFCTSIHYALVGIWNFL